MALVNEHKLWSFLIVLTAGCGKVAFHGGGLGRSISQGDNTPEASEPQNDSPVTQGSEPGTTIEHAQATGDQVTEDKKVQPPVVKGSLFVTSDLYSTRMQEAFDGQTFATGIEGADYRCQWQAKKAGLAGKFKALLGLSSSSPKDRLAIKFPVYSTTGGIIAKDKTDLWDGSISDKVAYENGVAPGGSVGITVLTAMNSDGTTTGTTCNDWNHTGTLDNYPCQGRSGGTSIWAKQNCQGTSPCGASQRIYCIAVE